MFKKLTALLLCLSSLAALSACDSNNSGGESGKVKVSVTFNALCEFVEAVGGDRVEVSTIIPAGTEPHDFEPKAQDLVALGKAQVFVFNGLGMESWTDDALSAAGNENLIVVDASKGVTPITNTDEAELSEHGQYDPHIWLSLKCAETEVTNIKNALVEADSAGKDFYENNCAAYIAKLEALYNEYSEKFAAAQKKSFVTGHAAFGYLCRDFGLTQRSVEDVFAEGEPSAKQLAELAEFCKTNGVKTIFAEEMASPEVSETLAGDVGAKVETIYTIESAQDNLSYLERMESNLSKIYASMS
ncbi:MAG: ABC transporter substrate-binding protein [Clostridia bacterium]|nr:ABC transporter substrate-binding protein [Clostridia bacterium]